MRFIETVGCFDWPRCLSMLQDRCKVRMDGLNAIGFVFVPGSMHFTIEDHIFLVCVWEMTPPVTP